MPLSVPPMLLHSHSSFPKLNSSLGKVIDYNVNQPISDSRIPRIVNLHFYRVMKNYTTAFEALG